MPQTALTGLDIKLLYPLATMLNIIRRMPSITKEPVRTMVWASPDPAKNQCQISSKVVLLIKKTDTFTVRSVFLFAQTLYHCTQMCYAYISE